MNAEKKRAACRLYSKTHRASINANKARRINELRLEVLHGYCGAELRCLCGECNVKEEQFLTIDHVNGGGRKERLAKPGSRRQLFVKLIKNGFPKEYTVLCWNCNCTRGIRGYCHSRPKRAEV